MLKPARLRLPKKSHLLGHLVIYFGSSPNFKVSAANELLSAAQGGNKKQGFHPNVSEAEKIYERSEFLSQGINTVDIESVKTLQ